MLQLFAFFQWYGFKPAALQLEKEEEEARQSMNSKQLAAAKVTAAESNLRKSRSRQTIGVIPELVAARSVRQSRLLSQRGDAEVVEQTQRDGTAQLASDNGRQKSTLKADELCNFYDKPDCCGMPHRGPANGVTDCRFVSDLERLKDELRMQAEEMRILQHQQRQVLQHMHYGNVFRGGWKEWERLRPPSETQEYFSSQRGLKESCMLLHGQNKLAQNAFQRRCALTTLLLKQAGVSEPEELTRSLVESGVIPLMCENTVQGMELMNKAFLQGKTAAAGQVTRTMGFMSSCADEASEDVHRCPSTELLSRRLSKSNCNSAQFAAGEKRENAELGDQSIGEDPEERPLPALSRRQQQHTEQPVPSSNVQQQRPVGQPEDGFLKNSPSAPVTGSSGKSRSVELDCQHAATAGLNRRATRQGRDGKTAKAPADRKWRLNELWACVNNGLPLPSPRRPCGQPQGEGEDGPWCTDQSWCSSDCRSELPCQTVILPTTEDCGKPFAADPLPKERTIGQKNGVPKSELLHFSQMECLEESTTQTAFSQELGGLSQGQQELYMALLSKLCLGRAVESIKTDTKQPCQSIQNDGNLGQPLLELQEAAQPLLDHRSTAEAYRNFEVEASHKCPSVDTEYQRICRALSLNAAPLRLQQLHVIEESIRRQYDTNASPQERCLRQLEALSIRQQAQESRANASTAQCAQQRFKSRLSWEADTAFPLDEGSKAQSRVTQAHVKAFGPRPFAPALLPPLHPVPGRDHHNSSATPDSSSPKPAVPPRKRALHSDKPNHAPSVTTSNRRRSRLSRVFGGMLIRSNSKTRQ